MPDIILSICIPTYNRGRILYENIKNWLKTSNQNFEIIVSDNCSDDNTLELLNSIDDNRLVILTNEKNMGGFINGNRTLLSGRGKYLMYLTDKDLISMEYFDDIIETLKNNDFATGRFVLNYKQNNCYLRRYTSKIKALRTVCFAVNHPSGIILNRELLHSKRILGRVAAYGATVRPFFSDFITTLLGEYGDVVHFEVPFLEFVPPPFNGMKHSYTYSQNQNNLFFMPAFRFKVFEVYLKFLKQEVKLSYFERLILIKRIIKDLFIYSTQEYIRILNIKSICDWYCLSDDFVEGEKKKPLERLFIIRLLKCKSFDSIFEYLFAVINFFMFYLKRNSQRILKNNVKCYG